MYSDMNDCGARLPNGGIPTSEIAYKMEETDIRAMGYYDYDSYLTDIAEDKNDYMRSAVADRQCEEPFANDETPTYNATKNSGKLNSRYNESRGTTDYKPHHPEMYIGDQAEELPIYLAKTKKFTAAKADVISHQMGNNDEQSVPEQAWADPEISFAKKDMMKWYGHTYNKWDWPSFVNFQTQNTRFFDPSDTMRRRHESINLTDAKVKHEPEVNDAYSKQTKQQVGSEYYLHPYCENTIAFSEQDKNKQRQSNQMSDHRVINGLQTDTQLKLKDHGVVTNNTRRLDVAILMKSAIDSQTPSSTLEKEMKGAGPKSHGIESDPKSRINKIIKEATPNALEIHSKVMSAPKYQTDYIKTHYKSSAEIPPWVLGNLHSIKRVAMGQTDQARVKREVEQSRDMYQEEVSKLLAAGLVQNGSLTANVSDTEHTTELSYSLYTKAMKEADGGALDRTRNMTNKTLRDTEYDDTQHTKMRSMPQPSRIQMYDKSVLEYGTFDQQDGLEQRGYQNWTRH